MKKKFLMRLALLAIAAFTVVSATAQAAPHYRVNGNPTIPAPGVTSIAWGTITLAATEGSPTGAKLVCHNAAAGTLFNPGGEAGAAGEGLTQVFATFDCEQLKICPAEAETTSNVAAKNLPWKNLLTEAVVGELRQETTGVKVIVECLAAKVKISEIPYIIGKKKGSSEAELGQRPLEQAGTGALHPGFLEFGLGSGELEVEGSLGVVRGKTEGSVKALGYVAQELISTSNP